MSFIKQKLKKKPKKPKKQKHRSTETKVPTKESKAQIKHRKTRHKNDNLKKTKTKPHIPLGDWRQKELGKNITQQKQRTDKGHVGNQGLNTQTH